MHSFNLKTYSPKQQARENQFYILNKGLNSGKPLKEPCPNSFVCSADCPQQLENLYWLSYALWKSNSYQPYLKGSVIPFVTIMDMKMILDKKLSQIKDAKIDILKITQTLKMIDRKEKDLLLATNKVKALKTAFLSAHLNC